MNCFLHDRAAAVGICAVCQKAVCRECVGRDTPRVVCRTCVDERSIQGFEYRSAASIGGAALGSVAVGGLAVGFQYAIGGGAFGPSVIDGQVCDPAAADFVRQWLSDRMLPPHCRVPF
ncbi:MAG: hypothetical protein HYU37_21045 [Acidobacteria bacterium]|nr:hypothetical protein [Acidobacteriota bacterium]